MINQIDMPIKEEKPNAVLFKLDNGQICLVIIKDNIWDWDRVMQLDMSVMTDKFDDVSAANPFEFIFVHYIHNEKKFIACNQKTIIPDHCFSKLTLNGSLQKLIEKDYNEQYKLI